MLAKLGQMMFDAKRQLVVLTGMFSLCCAMPNVANAIDLTDISAVYFFGDSLTDSGFNNTFNKPFYFESPNLQFKDPNFTTYGGHTWAQYIANDIIHTPFVPPDTLFPTLTDVMTNNSTPTYNYPPLPYPPLLPLTQGTNFACGGARTNAEPGITITWAPSVTHQVQNYLTNYAPEVLDPKAVYFLWSGANDMLYGFQTYTAPDQAPQFIALIDQTTTQIVNLVDQLSQRGAERVVVLSLPNIGVTPLILSQGTVAEQNAKNLTFIFNSLLNQKLGAFRKKNRHVKILYFDTYSALDNLIKNAKEGKTTYGFLFDNVTDPVCTYPPSQVNEPLAIYCTGEIAPHYLFADLVHPTDQAHRVLSLELEEQILLWN